jgi:hypothetical protein
MQFPVPGIDIRAVAGPTVTGIPGAADFVTRVVVIGGRVTVGEDAARVEATQCVVPLTMPKPSNDEGRRSTGLRHR